VGIYFHDSNQENFNTFSSELKFSEINSDWSNSVWRLPAPSYFFATSGGSVAPVVVAATALGATLVTALNNSTPFKINLVWDSTVTASSSFTNGAIAAAQALDNVLSDNITVNVGMSNTGSGGGAGAGPSTGLYETYTLTQSDLFSKKTAGDISFNSLPTTASVQGQSNVAVWNAQLKLWGLLSPTSTALDGSATFATDISPGAITGVVLHELHHALGGVPFGTAPDIFDLFRFTAPGKMLFTSFTSGTPSAQAYFSIDNGVTKLAYLGVSSDPSDFLNGIPTGGTQTVYNTAKDALSEFYYQDGSSKQYLSAVDLHLMDSLGYHLSTLSQTNALTASTLVSSTSTNSVVVLDNNANILFNLDGLNASIDKIYSISSSDASSPLAISAAQSVKDQSVLMLMGMYENLKLTVTGSSSSETMYGVAGTDTINGMGGVDSIILNYHTTSDTIYFNSTPNSTSSTSGNLDKVTGFLSTDSLMLSNGSNCLNGLCNLQSGALIPTGAATTVIQAVKGASAFTVTTAGADVLDITGPTYSGVSALIADLSSSTTGHTYATFGKAVANNSHFLAEYMGTDGLHIAEITQGTNAPTGNTHLASNSTGFDLVDLIGVTQHLNAAHLAIVAT
jgi:hypothetical protein